MTDWAYNVQTDMAFVIGKTAHRVAEDDDGECRSECGFEWYAREERRFEDDDRLPLEKYRCGRCNWDDVEEDDDR